MAHDVFISYKSEDRTLCDRILSLTTSLGFQTFVDVYDLPGGQLWKEQLELALKGGDIAPVVIVLCTAQAAASPAGVADEVRFAAQHGLTIIPIQFAPHAVQNILRAAGYPHPGSIHYIDAGNAAESPDSDVRLEDSLRRSLTFKVRQWLQRERLLGQQWCARIIPQLSFWENAWYKYFPFTGSGFPLSNVLKARGGSGKSVLLAHCIRSLGLDPTIYPVMVDESRLRNLPALAALLGARSVANLPVQVESLAVIPPGDHPGWKPIRVVFVVDGLDQMAIPTDENQKQLVDGMKSLIAASSTLIGCRTEVWDSWYAGRLSVRETAVNALEPFEVRTLLQTSTRYALGILSPLLLVPFFLDIALKRADYWSSLPASESEFLARIWNEALVENAADQQAIPILSGKQQLLDTIARWQLEHLTYDVPVAALKSSMGFPEDDLQSLASLKMQGLIVERPAPDGKASSSVRLRHDLLDNYSMARLVLRERDQTKSCLALFDRCEKDCGWSVVAMVMQMAHDFDHPHLKRIMFERFLYTLDRKQDQDRSWMNRSWAVTHVLRSSFRALLDLILEALAGECAPSLDPRVPDSGSHPGPSARLTQEAASTLASAFMVQSQGQLGDALTAVPILAAGLKKWKYKGRFLNALAKYDTQAALDAIITFGHQQLDTRDDLDSLMYVAQSLTHPHDLKSETLLRRIIDDHVVDPMIRRVAAVQLDLLRPGAVCVPEREEAEIIKGLALKDRSGKQYSDWKVLQEYAAYIEEQARQGHSFSPAVLNALVLALQHDQIYVRRSVAQALACFNDPMARDAVFLELTEENLPAEVRTACILALEKQLHRINDPASRQAFRYLLLQGARAAFQSGAAITHEALLELALRPQLRTAEDWLASSAALQVLPPSCENWTVECDITPEAALSPAIEKAIARASVVDVGPNLERKYRLAELHTHSDRLIIQFAETTWQEGRRFHLFASAHPDLVLQAEGACLVPMPLGAARVPGILVVHVLVLTSDARLILSLRSAKSAYAPLHWSASFEEQVREWDMQNPDEAFQRAAQRGMMEEFGCEVPLDQISVLSALFEMTFLNFAPVVLIRASETFQALHDHWSQRRNLGNDPEVEDVESMEADLRILEMCFALPDFNSHPFHPTSQLRAAILGRYLRCATY